MIPFDASEFRLVQERYQSGAANDESVDVGAPGPSAGKAWIVIQVGYRPSVAETQVVSFQKNTASGGIVALLNPVSLLLNPAYATPIEQGMSFMLLPGEYITARRASHTAGSSMALRIQFVEVDIPLYDYTEPQAAARLKRAASSMAQRLVGGVASRGGGGYGSKPPGGHGPLPK